MEQQFEALWFYAFCTMHLFNIWNENQQISLFYSYIAGSLHVSGPTGPSSGEFVQLFTQPLVLTVSVRTHPERTDTVRTNGCVNNSTNSPEDGPVGAETCRDPAIYE